jgi:hypothetical protein
MSYRTLSTPKLILTLGICFFAITGLASSTVIVRAEDPATPNTPGMGIPSSTVTQATTNPAPAVPVPKAEVVQNSALIIERAGVTTQDFKPGSDVVTPTTTGGSNDLKASDLTIQKSVETKAKATVEAVRTGAVPVFLLIAAPIAVMFWYQYKFIRSKKTSLATTEEKITTSVEFDKK